jgi:glycosyltransferase involved in cell wall biosynthesis
VPAIQPRFSIFIPIYNDSTWLAGAIESVVAQTYPDWELVVSDNASTEDVEGVMRRYPDDRVRFHRWSTHVAAVDNFNRSISLCRFEWLQFLSADDRLRPECLERMADRIECADARTRTAVVLTGCRRIDELGRVADWTYYGSWPVKSVPDGRYGAREWVRITAAPGSLPWNIGSLALSREVLEEMGGFYRSEIGLTADLEMAMRAAAYGDVEYIADPMLDYTVRSDSLRHHDFERNRARSSQTPLEAALRSAMAVHEERRAVTDDERAYVAHAVARSHVLRALQHRRLPGGRGRRGAAADLLAAVRIRRAILFEPQMLLPAVAAIAAPRALILRVRQEFQRRQRQF